MLLSPTRTIELNLTTEYRTMKKFTIDVSSGFVKAMMVGMTAITSGIAIESAPAHGANLSFADNLANPNDTPLFSFTADGTSNVTIQSYSWGGGTNATGETILPGGFDLNLTLFDASGNWYDERDDIGFSDLDFKFTGILPAGIYQVAIAAFGNNSAGFGDISTPFNGAGDFQGRTSAYAFDILNVNAISTAVPEPSSLIGTAMAGFTLAMFKRKSCPSKKEIN
jgi:hypothetical protein